jgi:hypothetical protein
VAVHLAIMDGGAMRKAAVAFCAFALLVGAPIVVLAWFGSLTDQGEKNRRRQLRLARQRSEAVLWQRTLRELQPYAAPHDDSQPVANNLANGRNAVSPVRRAFAGVRPGRARQNRQKAYANRPILGRLAILATAVGLAGCAPDYYGWEAVRPGMATAELTALVGAPQQIKSNGTVEVWQYCPGNFLDRDGLFDEFYRQPLFPRAAAYYVAVWVDNEKVREVKPYPVGTKKASCRDFFQTVW